MLKIALVPQGSGRYGQLCFQISGTKGLIYLIHKCLLVVIICSCVGQEANVQSLLSLSVLLAQNCVPASIVHQAQWVIAGEDLASKFSQYVNTSGISEPLRYRRPTPMIAPHIAVQSVMTALQMNDYPEENAGIQTAYLFSKPYQCESLIAGQVRKRLSHLNRPSS